MGRKYNFRPDKSRPKLLNYLILTKRQQKNLLKWSLYTLFLVFLSLVQDVLLSQVRIFGATTELIPCAIFVICILEGSQRGSVFALVAALCYLFSGTAPGVYSMVTITFLGVGSTLLRQVFLHEVSFVSFRAEQRIQCSSQGVGRRCGVQNQAAGSDTLLPSKTADADL
jgi:hypothetical protein